MTETNDMIECRGCGESVDLEDTYQGKCDACEDKQMVRSIR